MKSTLRTRQSLGAWLWQRFAFYSSSVKVNKNLAGEFCLLKFPYEVQEEERNSELSLAGWRCEMMSLTGSL